MCLVLPIHTPFGSCYACFGLVMVFLQVQNMHKKRSKVCLVFAHTDTLWALLCMFWVCNGILQVQKMHKTHPKCVWCCPYVHPLGPVMHVLNWVCNGVLRVQNMHKIRPKCVWCCPYLHPLDPVMHVLDWICNGVLQVQNIA